MDGPATGKPEIAPRVREELARVLASHEFRASRRCQDFLRYVVETTLEGHSDQLKERTIGIDVFDRDPQSYDPSDDATVRVKASEVRKRLGLYYAGEGHQNPVHVELPAGTYVPEFKVVTSEPAALTPAPGTAASGAAQPESRRFTSGRVILFFIIAAAAIGSFWFAQFGATKHTIVDAFWQPVLEQSATPVVLCAAYVPVYAPVRASGGAPPQYASDFALLSDQFVGGGDLLAITHLASMLGQMHRAYEVKIGTEASFSDLQSAPTVIVGYSYTRWKEISKEMRFFIDSDRIPLMILDNGKPTKWALPNLPPDKHTPEDYAIVTRVFHPDTRTMLVEIAGITQYGTMAASELVTNPGLLKQALAGAPPGWEKRNLQLVLHTKVISGMAASQNVVASYFW